MDYLFIFPSDYFLDKIVDSDLVDEYNVVASSWEVVTFNQQKWFDDKKLILSDTNFNHKKAIYRGWMMHPDLYNDFYYELLKQGIKLITKPNSYKLMHCFVDIYPELKDDTPRVLTYPLYSDIDVNDVKRNFKKFIVKDYVKSIKGSGLPEYFDSTISQSEFNSYLDKFYNYRGDLLTGGICIKEYVELKKCYDFTNEYRAFYLNNELMLVGQNSGQTCTTVQPPAQLLLKYKDLNSPFYTIDYAELYDGSWVILETGDGGVSGIPNGVSTQSFYKNLERIIENFT